VTTGEALSAQGTKLNRRGRENRQAIIATAIRCLAVGGTDALSANRIAKEAGVTWGTIQHQFGDSDGVWSAVIEHVAVELTRNPTGLTARQRTLSTRVTATVEWLRLALDRPSARAVQTIRMGLPLDPTQLAREYPKTASALLAVDAAWSVLVEEMLNDVVASRSKIHRVQQLLPAAMHGIQMQAELSPLTDAGAARRGLAEAITAYLKA
jgi:AcrR family transcriptional regulator